MKKLSALLSLLVPASVFSASPQIWVVNPVSDGKDWTVVDSRHIYDWGRSQGLFMRPDMGLIRDGLAGYLPADGRLVLKADDLKTERQYFLLLNIVTFGNPDSRSFPSMLKVFLRGGGYSYREAACFSFGAVPDGIAVIPVPYELSQGGEIEILLEEYTGSSAFLDFKGLWGFWDIILSDTANPSKADIKLPAEKLDYKSSILE